MLKMLASLELALTRMGQLVLPAGSSGQAIYVIEVYVTGTLDMVIRHPKTIRGKS